MGARFHADVRIPVGAAADAANADGTLTVGNASRLLFQGQTPYLVTRVRISTDTAMRIVVGAGDADGQRVMAGTFGANGGAAPDTCYEAAPNEKLYVLHSAAGVVDVSIDGHYLDSPG